MTDYHHPIPSRATKKAISKFAEDLREETGIQNGFDLAELVKLNGGELSYKGFLDTDQTDAILVQRDESFRISLSAHTGALRDNFTIAHELGHLLLHWPIVRDTYDKGGMRATRRVDESKKDLRRCEWEANWFASSFLMPQKLFEDLYKKGTAPETLGVTPAAVKVRAKSLGIE